MNFERICKNCQQPYGEHSMDGTHCPTGNQQPRFDSAKVFVPIDENTHTNHQCCERDHDNDGNCDIHSAPGVLRRPTEVGRAVEFDHSRGLKQGQIVEVVEAGKLPTFAGLRHIADKRRQPKPRIELSFVVTTAAEGRTPTRAQLFWPFGRDVRFL